MHTHEKPTPSAPTSTPQVNPVVPGSLEVRFPNQVQAASPTNPFPRRSCEVWTPEPVVARKPDTLTEPLDSETEAISTGNPTVQQQSDPSAGAAQTQQQTTRREPFRLYAPDRPAPSTMPWWGVQTKVTIGQPNDAYEQEADRVAAQVMSMSPPTAPNVQRQDLETEDAEMLQTKPLAETITPLVQRQAMPEDEEPIQAKCDTCETEEPIQRATDGMTPAQPDLESRLNASRGGGSALPDEVRSFMEPRFGADFSQVRVHTGGDAVQMNREVSAQAFAHGQNIYFGAGKSPANDALTAHELTHVVQQTGTPRFNPRTNPSIERKSLSNVVQRDLTEDQKKSWKDLKGDQYVNQIKSSVEDWKKFRGKPDSFEQIPKGGSAPSQMSELLETADPAYKQYAAEQLGSESVTYLSEMAAFIPSFRLLIGIIPGVAYVDAAHHYKMTASRDMPSLPLEVPLSLLQVEYSNAFGWHWNKELYGSSLKWKVGIGAEKGKGLSGSGTGGSTPLIPEVAGISVNTEALATPVPYWGYKDLAGPTLVVGGPSAKGTIRGFGVKAISGGIIQLVGTGTALGTLDFMNGISHIGVKPAKPSKPKDAQKNAELSITLVEGSAGVLIGGAQMVAIPELAPEPVPEEKVWRYVVSGFETGNADLNIPEGEVHPIIEMIRKEIEDKKKNIESIKPYLKKTGITQEFKLDFYSEGYASRLWTGAGNNTQVRLQKNLDLSKKRAQNITSMLNVAFGSEHIYSFDGKGAAVYLPEPNSQFGKVLPESGNEQILEQLIRERAEQYMKDHPNLSPEEARRMAEQDRKIIESNLGKTSNVPFARRVNITIIWRGFDVKWGANASPAPQQVD